MLNFGDSLVRWVDVFYKNITYAVSLNGHFSSFFSIGRGCRQGDPLSPYLFIICAEFLSTMIKNDKKIKGITVSNTEFKISQFADDTSIFLDGSAESLKNTLDELDKFAKVSGLKISYDKTQLVWIGSKKYSSDSIKTKCKEQSLSLLVFKYKLKFMFKVHKQIAYTEEKHETFLKEWSPYLLLFNDIVWFNAPKMIS